MPLEILTCDCGGAEELARNCIKDGGYKKFLSVPLYKGPKQADIWFSQLSSVVQGFLETQALMSAIEHKSGYVIIVGWNNKGLVWADIGDGGPADVADGQTIAEAFANL